MDCPSRAPPLYGSRFCFLDKFRYYYAYGNTPAQNFLEYAASDLENKEPLVLVLGCGDIRSCFYTIWKNFDPVSKHRFDGVHFVLNDRSAAVLARNIIFLYLCLKTPKSKSKREKWLLIMWSIWFCHELLPDHASVLQNTLKTLLEFSVDKRQWSSPNNPLHSLVCFFPRATFKEIREIWSMWYNGEVKVSSVESMKLARQKELTKLRFGTETEATRRLIGLCSSLGMDFCKDIFTLMISEYRSYLESGTVFGESLLGDVSVQAKETSVNFTLYERGDGRYTLNYGSCPFRCFQQTFVCSVENMMNAHMHVNDSVKDNMFVNTEAFKRLPLLANSFQQFSIWMSSAANVLQSHCTSVSFTFNCMDVFRFCESWEVQCSKKQFDLILASNVIDSVAPPAFILAVTRLLKDNSHFLATSMLYKLVASTVEEYIETTFGFHPKLLPVICGVRCINHEGSAYASPVSPSHIPMDTTDYSVEVSNIREKVLIWKKVDMYPLYIDSLSSYLDISLALCNSFRSLCTSLLNGMAGSVLLNFLCTDTATMILERFAGSLNIDCAQSHRMWTQLCSDLKKQSILKPFLTSIQIQALVRGLHLHLVVDETTCPTCTDLPLSEYLGLFCVPVHTKSISYGTPKFTICLQNKPFVGLNGPWESGTLQSSHCIDCVDGVTHDSMLKLTFLAPLTFVKDCYRLALFQHTTVSPNSNVALLILQGELSKYRVDLPSVPPPHRPQPLLEHSSSLGTLIRHCGNGDEIESTVSFAEEHLPALLTARLQVEQVSHTEIMINCLDCSLQIKYPYPVAYASLIIHRSEKTKTLTVKAKREVHRYEDEGQVFHVNPEDHFSLPLITINSDKLNELVSDQYTLKECKILMSDPEALTSPLLKVKKIIRLLLTLKDEFIFHLVLPGSIIVGIVEVVNRVVDVSRKVPALDLCFCFLDTLGEDVSSFIADQLTHVEYDVVQLFLYEEAYDLLKKIFWNFSSHTLQSAGKYSLFPGLQLMKRCGVEHHFRRAVVYPLYQDPDISIKEMQCRYCKQVKPQKLKECTGCKSVSYCSKQCQRNHWSEHKLQCKSTNRADKSPTSAEVSSSLISNSKPPLAAQQEQPSSPIDDSSLLSEKQEMVGQNKYKGRLIAHKHTKLAETRLSTQLSEPRHQLNTGKHCSFCHKGTPSLKSCSRCHKTSYCGKECQRAHWKEHKSECCDSNLSDRKLDNTLTCSYCELHLKQEDLKKCTGCKRTSYCSKACQIHHWNEHKLQCKGTKSNGDESPSSTLETSLHKSGPSVIAKQWEEQSLYSTGGGEDSESKSPTSEKENVSRYEELPMVHEETLSQTSEQDKQSKLHPETLCAEHCSYCQKQTPSLKSCTRCRTALYCGKKCQTAHWKEHKHYCKSPAK